MLYTSFDEYAYNIAYYFDKFKHSKWQMLISQLICCIKQEVLNQGEALYIIKTLVLHIISGKATVSHQADRIMHTYGVMIYAA